MSVIYNNALKDTRMTAVVSAIDGGGAAGSLEICSANYVAVLVIIPLAYPSFSEGSQMITMLGVPRLGTAQTNGTAAIARIRDSNGNVVVSGLTVNTSSADVVINTVGIVATQEVTLTSGQIIHG